MDCVRFGILGNGGKRGGCGCWLVVKGGVPFWVFFLRISGIREIDCFLIASLDELCKVWIMSGCIWYAVYRRLGFAKVGEE